LSKSDLHNFEYIDNDNKDQQAKCRECQECCKHLEIPVTMLSLEVVEYFIMRGDKLHINPKNGVMSLRTFKPCQHLTKDGCGIYDSRPWTCQTYICEIKDKSIWDIKEKMFEEGTKNVLKSIQQHREKQA